MDPVFSMEEILGPLWDLPLPLPPTPPEQQPLVATGTGSVVVDGVLTHGGDGEGEQQPLVIGRGSVIIDGGFTQGGDGEGGHMMDQIQNTMEWTFERFLEEEHLTNTAPLAFKLWRASSSGMNSGCSQSSNNNHNGADLGSKNQVHNKLNNSEDPVNNHAQNADPRVRLPTCSSWDPSPSDQGKDGGVKILGFKMPTEERMRKRREGNRESARRSRYRKAAHLKDLENQVEKLKAENSCLLRRLAAMNQKYKEANVDNRVLKADIETLRAKVKMGEDSLKQVLGMSSLTSIPIPELPSLSDVPVPIQDDIVNYLTTTPTDDALVDNSFMPMPDPLQLQLEAEKPSIS